MSAGRPSLNPFALLARGLLWLLGVGLLTLLIASGLTTRLDNALYDLHLRHWGYQPGDDVVIVAIDPKSLDALGRWPWPRAMHAQLLDRLTAAGVRGVGMDVTISEADADHPENDQLLAQALKRNGRVVMPLFAEPTELGGPPQEILPLPIIMQSAAALGQVDVEEGTVRGAYLKAGLGQPYWPLMALAVYQLDNPAATKNLPGLRSATPGNSPYLWERDHYVLLRYAGGGGSFGRVSYVDVLRGQVSPALLKNRWVLVGATAEGLGDAVATPDGIIPGVEYQANVLESLRRGSTLTPMDISAQWLIGICTLALPLLLYGSYGFRPLWAVALVGLLFPPLLSLLLLRIGMLWWPPSGAVLLIGAGLLGWSAFNWYQRRAADVGHAVTRLA